MPSIIQGGIYCYNVTHQMEKTTKINLFFSMYLVFFTATLVTHITLLKKTPTAIIEITSSTQNCQLLEVFTNIIPEVSSDTSNYHPITIKTNNEFSTYSIVIPLPLRYLRIDPCDKKQQSEISNISIRSQNKIYPLSLNPESFTCHSCLLSIEEDSLHISPLTNDPIMIANNLEGQISSLNAEAIILFTLTYRVTPLVILLLLCIPFFFIINTNIFLKLIPLIPLMAGGALVVKVANIKTIIKGFLVRAREMSPLPQIGEEHIVGFAQYEGYPLYFEMWLFIIFLLILIILSFLLFTYFKHRNK